MRNWTELASDVNWEDYHGMWTRRAKDGSWYVLKWTNLVDAGGDEFADTPYECSVVRLDLTALTAEQKADALRFNSYDGAEGETATLAMVECCVQYGFGAPLETFTGRVRPRNIRAEARRYAEECMRDAAKLAKQMARPVNAIGSTAEEYGLGDINSALHRGPLDPTKALVRKMTLGY
jgi:hypothetical protein